MRRLLALTVVLASCPRSALPPATRPASAPAATLAVAEPGEQTARVRLHGVEFTVTVAAVAGPGGFGLATRVDAEVVDGRPHRVPDPGEPVLFLGAVLIAADDHIVSYLGDAPPGSAPAAIDLAPGSPLSFRRAYPPDGEAAVAPGERLELTIGLAGLAGDDGRTTPVLAVAWLEARAGGATVRLLPVASAEHDIEGVRHVVTAWPGSVTRGGLWSLTVMVDLHSADGQTHALAEAGPSVCGVLRDGHAAVARAARQVGRPAEQVAPGQAVTRLLHYPGDEGAPVGPGGVLDLSLRAATPGAGPLAGVRLAVDAAGLPTVSVGEPQGCP